MGIPAKTERSAQAWLASYKPSPYFTDDELLKYWKGPENARPSPLMTNDEVKEFVARGWFPKSTRPSPIATDDEIKQLLELEKQEALSNAVEEGDKAKIAKKEQGLYNEGYKVDKNEKDNELFRGDDLLYEEKRPNGISKSYINPTGDLIPANVEGLYKGRQVTVLEHILGGYRKGAKGNSPYTSFTKDKDVIVNYGNNIIKLDLNGLTRDIKVGKIRGVEILIPEQIQAIIKSDAKESEYWRELASNWAKRDQEYLIKGVIPKKYITIISKGGI